MNYKIAIIGTQSSGKTTLAKELSNRLGIPLITELARKWDVEKATREELIDIQRQMLDAQINEEIKYEQFVSDRSTIDNLAYWIHNVGDIVDDIEDSIYKIKAFGNVYRYSHIFLLSPEFYPVNDGFRNTDIIYQMRIDAVIQAILRLYGIKYYKLTGSVVNRVNEAMMILNDMKLRTENK